MTELTKPVSRVTRTKHSRWDRRIVVTLEPGDVVRVRLERLKQSYLFPIQKLYDTAEIAHARALLTAK